MPDTRPNTTFTDGVCQACLNYAVPIDRVARLEELREWCKANPHCLVAVSGGKDSHFIVNTLKEYDIKEIVLLNITDSFTKTQAGICNLKNLYNISDGHLFQNNYPLKKTIWRIRLNFEINGEPLKTLEKNIYDWPRKFSKVIELPVVFGDDPGWTYGSTDFEVKPTDQFAYMGYFKPWDYKTSFELVKNLGFRSLGDEWTRNGYIEDYEQIDSFGYIIHIWMKYPKFGFQRTSDMVSRRIRHGVLTLEEGKKLIEENDYKIDPTALDDFCKTLGYTEPEFWEIVERHRHPNISLDRTRKDLERCRGN